MGNMLDDFEDGTTTLKEKPAKPQGGRRSKNKGKTGERACADYLKKKTSKNWQRIPNSGAFIGRANRRRIMEMTQGQVNAALGDIFPPDGLHHRFIIECKNYMTFPYRKFANREIPKKLDTWLNEIQYDCETYLDSADERKHVGLLYVKITTSRQTHVFGNVDYIHSILNHTPVVEPVVVGDEHNLPLFFDKAPLPRLATQGYGDVWFCTDFKYFVDNNLPLFREAA